MSAPAIVHIVGPQGTGKPALSRWLTQTLTAAGQTVAVVEDVDCHADNDAIRAVYRSADLIVTLADEPGDRHQPSQLERGDLVLHISGVTS